MDWTTTLDLGSASSSDLLEKRERDVWERRKWANSYILAAIWPTLNICPIRMGESVAIFGYRCGQIGRFVILAPFPACLAGYVLLEEHQASVCSPGKHTRDNALRLLAPGTTVHGPWRAVHRWPHGLARKCPRPGRPWTPPTWWEGWWMIPWSDTLQRVKRGQMYPVPLTERRAREIMAE